MSVKILMKYIKRINIVIILMSPVFRTKKVRLNTVTRIFVSLEYETRHFRVFILLCFFCVISAYLFLNFTGSKRFLSYIGFSDAFCHTHIACCCRHCCRCLHGCLFAGPVVCAQQQWVLVIQMKCLQPIKVYIQLF